MVLEDFFNEAKIHDLSFFNFRNAITAAYYADENLKLLKVNDNFRKFFPVLENLSDAYFPDVLKQLGISEAQVSEFVDKLTDNGFVLIPEILITIDGKEHMYSLLSTRTRDADFSYLNGVQGQFVDRTAEWLLRREREELLSQQLRDREVIEEKSRRLEQLAGRLAQYLSPQIYQSIFTDSGEQVTGHSRKSLTIFFSDIVQFTDIADSLEPERLAALINSYLSEMSRIAIECGGTIDKFIGDAILVFFGDPETAGEREDALKCIDMALRMRIRIDELDAYWKTKGIHQGLTVRTGIATGYCTVGNFGSEQRLDYTVLGRPVNLAARLEAKAQPGKILIDETTFNLVRDQIACTAQEPTAFKGFSRPLPVYQIDDYISEEKRLQRRTLSRIRNHVEVNIIDSSNIRAAITELKEIQEEFEEQLASSEN